MSIHDNAALVAQTSSNNIHSPNSAFTSYKTDVSHQNQLSPIRNQIQKFEQNISNNNNDLDCQTFKSLNLTQSAINDASKIQSELTSNNTVKEKTTCSSLPVSPRRAMSNSDFRSMNKTKLHRTSISNYTDVSNRLSLDCEFRPNSAKNSLPNNISFLTGQPFTKFESSSNNFENEFDDPFENSAFFSPTYETSFEKMLEPKTWDRPTQDRVPSKSTELTKAIKIVLQDEIKLSERYFAKSSRKEMNRASSFVDSAVFQSKESLSALNDSSNTPIIKPTNKTFQQTFNYTLNNYNITDAKNLTKTIKQFPTPNINITKRSKEPSVSELIESFDGSSYSTTDTDTSVINTQNINYCSYSSVLPRKFEYGSESYSSLVKNVNNSYNERRVSSPVISSYNTSTSPRRRDRFMEGYLNKMGGQTNTGILQVAMNNTTNGHSAGKTTLYHDPSYSPIPFYSNSLPRRSTLPRPMSTTCMLGRDSFTDDPEKRKEFVEKYLLKAGKDRILQKTSN